MTETSLAVNPEPMTLSFKVRRERRQEGERERERRRQKEQLGGSRHGGGEKNETRKRNRSLPFLSPSSTDPVPRPRLAPSGRSLRGRQLSSHAIQTFSQRIRKQDLNYYVPAVGSGWNTILRSVTGECRAARLTACMGPSGAGKSTLLKILACNIAGGVREGDLMVNGE